MGSNSLNNRSAGQTIQDTFFNDIHQAMNGDFIGRGATGVPTAGQNLGTVAIPWGTLRTDNIILGGSAVDTSQLTSPQNRVISGKTRTSSNQPAFIVPNGAAASFLIDGTPTNLVVDINGASVTVGTDITKGSLTTAPASQNTALVDDATAADQHDTRLWGEPLHHKKITIDTVGTNITNLVGKFASFRITNGADTEYFMAYVESPTLLSKCQRGYFYNSTSTPMNRIFFSNNDTITLMSTAWVFIENDGTTCDVTYTNPVWSFTSPSSPATGDYWYDLANQLWKRYDGASFQIINRTFIGIAVIDTTNCVAARSSDLYYNYSSLNTIDVEPSTTEIVLGKSIGQRVSVTGNHIDFQYSTPSWNITTDLADATDMYSSTEQSSRQYYLYISDVGETIISDISPYYRYDLYGRYHPHNPWRCVGMAYNDSSGDIVQAGGFSSSGGVVFNTPFGNGVTSFARLYSVIENATGADVVALLDNNEGARVDIYEPGTYVCYYNDLYSLGTCTIGIEKNKANFGDALTVNITSDQSIAFANIATGFAVNVSGQPILYLGENLRPMNNGNVDAVADIYKFRVALVQRLFPY